MQKHLHSILFDLEQNRTQQRVVCDALQKLQATEKAILRVVWNHVAAKITDGDVSFKCSGSYYRARSVGEHVYVDKVDGPPELDDVVDF